MIAYKLEGEQAEAIEQHAGECPECAALVASVTETLDVFSDVPVPEAEFERSWEQVRGQLRSSAGLSFTTAREVEMGVWASLWGGVRDALFAKKTPELVLESKPVAVVDRMAVKRDWRGLVGALAVELIVVMAVGAVTARKIIMMAPATHVTELNAPLPPAPPQPKMAGGGGGSPGATPVAKGNLPPRMAAPVPKIEQSKLIEPPAIDLQASLKMPTVNMPNFGDPRSPVVGSSTGNGKGGGIGSGSGGGLGAGNGGNTGGGVKRVGGSVSAPVLMNHIEPEFSDEARKAKFAGNVLVYLVVDTQGRPQNVRVIKPVGMGLDEKAMEAVRRYIFKPAMENGKPVPVELSIEVDFQIF